MSALLRVRDVTVRFGGVTALQEVSFDVTEGELLGLIGPNGAGKTTLMRVITGVVTQNDGTVTLAGRNITRLKVHARIRLGLGHSHQLVRPFRSMTLLDNVALAAGLAKTRAPLKALAVIRRDAERRRAEQLLKLLGIDDAADSRPATLPLGYLKRLELARALALDPDLLLLDEPLAGLNHLEARRLADTVVDLNRSGRTVVLIEHNLGEVMRICSRLVVLDNGRKIGEGDPREVMADNNVRAAYLGTGDAAA
ncbi:MAG TPA: ATP-binding cassette domain-containing protein [Gammaproteobacteria bacterium]|nr:ATP-binding cassette domain-containing protein [Gammaproteobacteria bacterium]